MRTRQFAIALAIALAGCAPSRSAAPPPFPSAIARDGATRFAVIGDFGADTAAEAAVAALVHSLDPDFVATVGDNNYPKGEARTIEANIGRHYGRYIGRTGENSTNRFFPALGNHDWSTDAARAYLDYFDLPGNERYYDVRRGSVHLFVVDSDAREPDGITSGSVQALWLRDALANTTAPFRLVLLHHPPYSSGRVEPQSALQWPFAEWGATAVLAGHDHVYERLEVGGVLYFVNGLGGKSIYEFESRAAGSRVRFNADYGAMWVEADEETCTFRFVARDGVVVDAISVGRSGALLPETPLVSLESAWGDRAESARTVRQTFSVADPSAFSGLRLRVLCDAGAVVRLNGVGLLRVLDPEEGVAPQLVEARLGAGALAPGPNALEIEIAGGSGEVALSAALVGVGGRTVLPLGSPWRHADASARPAANWRERDFDDSAWAASAAPRRPAASPTYFRRLFDVTDARAIRGLALRHPRAGETIVTLNGREVHRANPPAGTDGEALVETHLPPGALVTGSNAIAVEWRPADPSGGDASFDLELIVF